VETIFISIAACKEEFLAQTIKSAIANAKNPELLYFGISNMVIDQEDFLSDPIFDIPNINYIDIKHKEPLGTGFGRMTSSLMVDRQHKYFLQVDAHNIFEKNWDETVKEYYSKLLKVCKKPIITTCPLRWADGPQKQVWLFDDSSKEIDPYDFKTTYTNPSIKINVVDKKNPRNKNKIMKYAYVEATGHEWKDSDWYKEHSLIFAAFLFTDFSFVREILHDPLNPWDGDQTNMSFRAGTRGYRMFTVKDCFIWTKDKVRNGLPISNYDWRTKKSMNVKNFYFPFSTYFQSQMFSGEYLGYWGAPTKESIKEYNERLGIDLSVFFTENYLTISET
jgi:hypothetical protein